VTSVKGQVIAVNATAYDGAPSGTRNRAVGLSAALLRAGVNIDILTPPDLDVAALVAEENGGVSTAGQLRVLPVTLEARRPVRRALHGPGQVAAALDPRRHALFLTDYFPVSATVPTVLSIHDLRYLAGQARGASGRARQGWFKAFYPRIARRAPIVLVLTDTRGDEAARLLNLPRNRVVTVPMAVGRVFREADPATGRGRHLIAVGMGDERKGAEVLARAQALAAARGPVLPVVLTGRRTPHLDAVLAHHRGLLGSGLLRYVGVVSDAELVALYRDAAALLHPSRYEGFGVPVLEALSFGLPVLAAEDPAVREVAGDRADYLDGEDVEVWAVALERLGDPTRAVAVARARRHVAGWDAAGATFLEAVAPLLRR